MPCPPGWQWQGEGAGFALPVFLPLALEFRVPSQQLLGALLAGNSLCQPGFGGSTVRGWPLSPWRCFSPSPARHRAELLGSLPRGCLLCLWSGLQDFWPFFAPKKVAEAGQAHGDAERQLFRRQTPGLLLEKHHFLLATKGSSHPEPHGCRVTFTRDALSFFFC